MKKILLMALSGIILITLCLTSSCKKDDDTNDDFVNPQVDGIRVTIPRAIVNDGKLSIFISVTDLMGVPIKGLNKNNITLTRRTNGNTENIDLFNFNTGQGGSTPIKAGLAMDYSGSMYFDSTFVPSMENAVKTFINLKNATDEMEIIKFDNNVVVVQPFTADSSLLHAAVDSAIQLGGSTALYEACLTALDNANQAVANLPNFLPAVVAFTDGVNNRPPHNPDTVVASAMQMQIPVYTIGFGGIPTYQPDTTTLQMIADSTGGRFFWTPNATDINQLYQYVSNQLSNSYIVTTPWNNKGYSTLTVTVNYQGFTATATRRVYH